MALIKDIIDPVSELIEDEDEEYDGINWEASLPSRGEEGAISIEIMDSQLIIGVRGPAHGVYYPEWDKTIDISEPGSLDKIREIMEGIRDGYEPEDGVDGWEEH
jgi:hypothetical protein